MREREGKREGKRRRKGNGGQGENDLTHPPFANSWLLHCHCVCCDASMEL